MDEKNQTTGAPAASEADVLLDVQDLKVSYHTYAGVVQSVRGVSFSLEPGGTLAIVGESGCGKSVSAKAIMGLVKDPGVVDPQSHIVFKGRDTATFSKEDWRSYKGGSASMIFQEALSALDPTTRVGKQITEAILAHEKVSKEEAKKRAIELLREVGIPEPERRFRQFPHELSGGMRQRVMISIAFACNPELLICDEPTTALDVTIQDQILSEIREMQRRHGTAVIMITHDMGVVADIARDMVVMYSGLIVERGSVADIFAHPRHPYTKALLAAVPRVDQSRSDELAAIQGTPPDLINPPTGCPFCTRCPYRMDACTKVMPPETDFGSGRRASCWLHDERSPRVDEVIQAAKEEGGVR
ncbi:MAG TPA: ABC transporter ATP-binding protein [Candidatus Olsenella pullicola]|nr:ABC transporter ATP-binding protein [Candidatus Olsenella pullicola]